MRGVNDFSVISPVSLHNLGSLYPSKVLMIAVSVDGKEEEMNIEEYDDRNRIQRKGIRSEKRRFEKRKIVVPHNSFRLQSSPCL